MVHVAVIQGSSRGIGLEFARHLLANTSLQVVATTSRRPSASKDALLSALFGKKGVEDRLTTLELNVRDEDSIAKAAKEVDGRFGKSLRFLVNVSGVLIPEKSITKIDADDMRKTFELNTFGHMLTFKHFVPLLPGKQKDQSDSYDPADGVLPPKLSVLASMSARVGSIEDNKMGGWYSYRASKAAVNQTIVTLQRELKMRSSAPSIAVALHPGTVAGTDLSSPFAKEESRGKKHGVHGPDTAVEGLMAAIAKMTLEDGGAFIDWEGKPIPW